MPQADRNNSRLAHRPGMPISSTQRSGPHNTPQKQAANSSAKTGNNSERELVAVTECPILGRRRESLRGCEKAAAFDRGIRHAHLKKWIKRLDASTSGSSAAVMITDRRPTVALKLAARSPPCIPTYSKYNPT